MLTLVNLEASPTFDGQSVGDSTDWNAMTGGTDGTFVLTGCGVTQHTGSDMAASVASGTVYVAGTSYSVAGASVTITAASVSDRKDIVVYTVGTGLQVIAGTPCGTAGWSRANASSLSTPPPVKSAIPASSVLLAEVYVSSTTTVITTAANIIDKTNVCGLAGQAIATINMGAFGIINASQILLGESSTSSQASLDFGRNATLTGSSTIWTANLHETITVNSSSLVPNILAVAGTYTLQTISGKTNSYCVQIAPNFSGSVAPSSVNGISISPSWAGSGTLPVLNGVYVNPTTSTGTVTKFIGFLVGNTSLGTLTTTVGLDIGVTTALAGSTIWGMQVGNYNSYHQGKFTFGGTGAPTWDIHVQGGSAATSGIGLDVSASVGPTAPSSNASGVISIYKGTNYYLLVTFNDGGTPRYKYIQLNGTGTTWAQGTTLPT